MLKIMRDDCDYVGEAREMRFSSEQGGWEKTRSEVEGESRLTYDGNEHM